MKLLRNQPLTFVFSCGLLLASAALPACASDSTSGDGDGDGDATGGMAGDGDGAQNTLPADFTQASIESFLAAETYKQPPWVGDAEVRAGGSDVNVHGDNIRVYYNPVGLEARKAADTGSMTSALGSMAVKEIYNTEGALVGRATSIKSGEGNTRDDWTYYCSITDGSTHCTGAATPDPIYGAGVSECGFCHGNVFYAAPPQ